MGKNRSKSIGGEEERRVARVLSEWLTGNDEELCVWRTSGSGSVSTIAKRNGKNALALDGDFQLISRHEDFSKVFKRFFFDAKSLTGLNYFFINPNNIKSNKLIWEWEKVVKDAGEKVPIMLVKDRDNRQTIPYVFLPVQFKFPVGFSGSIMTVSIKDTTPFVVITQLDFLSISWYTMLELNAKEI
jgi:hypothetical protein